MAVLEEENKQQEILINNNKTRTNTLLNKYTDRQESIVSFKDKVEDLEKSLKSARQEVNDLEQYGRRTMCIIKGVPTTGGRIPQNVENVENDETSNVLPDSDNDTTVENTNNIVLDIAKHLKLNISRESIDISHRTSNKEDADIIVKFKDRASRDAFFTGRKSIREQKTTSADIGFNKSNKIFINESLTQINGELHSYARTKLLKTDRFKYVWTSQGQIKAKRNDHKSSKTIILRSKEDINKEYNKNKPQRWTK